MFLKALLTSGILLGSTFAAQAVTIQPGETYEATYAVSTDQIDPALFLPILSFDGPIAYIQYNVAFSGVEPGGDVTITQLEDDRSLFGEITFTNPGATPGFVGGIGQSCIACTISSTGFIQVRNDSATAFVIDSLSFLLSVAATVELPDGSPFETSLAFTSPVTGFQRVDVVTPPPSVIPLPASAALLFAGLLGLAAVRRRRTV